MQAEHPEPERPAKPCLIVHGDGVNDDADALQAYMDGEADLIHADGTPYKWPGTPGRRYLVSRTLYIGFSTEPRVVRPLGRSSDRGPIAQDQ